VFFVTGISLFGCSSSGNIIAKPQTPGFAMAFYNVENLFDTIDEPSKQDEDFMPQGKNAWSAMRYRTKIDHLVQVICAIDSQQTLALVGLAEIENRRVLDDLARALNKKGLQFEILHFESPDRRGIDVAALYRADKLVLTKSRPIPVRDADDPHFLTRDILYAQFTDKQKRIWHIYVNHWPSRYGGEEKSAPKRLMASAALKSHITDSVLSADTSAMVAIMGDFNDYPDNESILNLLHIGSPPQHPLVNLSWDIHNRGEGSSNYRCKWGMIDQMIISESVVSLTAHFKVHRKDYMLYYNKYCKQFLPTRTYSGGNYFNGYSDHLPVVLQLK
jgi:predicted extracellular nuclease